jgi:hypothetical protein
MTSHGTPIEIGLSALLLHLEVQLMDPEFRKNRADVAEQLAEEFREIGSSGRFWTRQEILELLTTEPAYSAPRIEDFSIQRIASGAMLVSYRAERADAATLRSSIWIYHEARWQCLFHQGTRVP